MNLTLPTALILQALVQGYQHGFDIMDTTGLPAGTVYTALRRLENEGLIESYWEDEKIARENQRPTRRYYRVKDDGEAWLSEARKRYPRVAKLFVMKPARHES